MLDAKPYHEMTPRRFLSLGKGWVSLYRAGKNGSGSKMIASNYCLLFALELYLKAYITTIDKRYSTERELKHLGHKLSIMIRLAKESLPQNHADILDRFCSLQRVMVNDYPESRYPMLKRGVRQLYGGQEDLIIVLRYIERVIKGVSFKDWWEREV